MGGKQKQGANRVKNNARPSSSSRSADVLGGTPSFSGFYSKDGLTLAILPGLSAAEEMACDVTPEFLLVFKKMSKKDTTTKLKALNEFLALIQSSSEAEVQETLAMWPRLYGLLSMDIEHRVREAAQVAHSNLMTKCGRNVAPYLKQLVPIWVVSQYDTYVPAALQAQTSLQKTFPSKKLPEVMAYCKVEILSYIYDNLIEHTATTLSNPKSNTPEECEAKYERVIIASLHGYSILINNLPEAHTEWLCNEQDKILSNNKFWSFGKHKVHLIRAAWYTVIGSLSQVLCAWFNNNYGKKAVIFIFNQLNEKDSTVTPQIWENSILLMSNIKDWWTYTDLNKNILSGILTTLKCGGWGSAEHIAPLMLPLLAQLSAANLEETFYDEYFESILKGLETRSIITSKTEYSAWLKGLSECLKYISMNGKENIPQLISKTLREWISRVARPHISINPYTPLKLSTAQLSELSFFWTKQSDVKYSQFTRLFWQNILFIITTQLEKAPLEDDAIREVTDIHRELLVGLKNNLHLKTKRGSRVKFQNHDTVEMEIESKSIKIKENVGPSNIKKAYERELNNVVFSVCSLYLRYAQEKSISSPILLPLQSLISEFDKEELYHQLLRSVVYSKETRLFCLYSELFSKWIWGPMRSQAVVDLTFSLFSHLNVADQRVILKSFDQLPTSIMKWCISRCLAYPFCTYEPVQEWLHSNAVHSSLIAMCKDVINEGDQGHANLLKMCFAQDNNGEILISKASCSAIIQMLANSLLDIDSEHLDMCASFASQLASTICIDKRSEDCEKLLLGLFKLNCIVQGENETLSSDTWWEVNTSWQDVLSSLGINKMKSFAEKAMNIIYEELITSDDQCIDFTQLDNFVILANNIVTSCTVNNSSVQKKVETFVQISPLIFRLNSGRLNSFFNTALKSALISDLMKSRITTIPILNSSTPVLNKLVSNADNKLYKELDVSDLNNLLKWVCFGVKVLDKILFTVCADAEQNKNDEDDDEDSEDESESPLEFVFSGPFQEIFSLLMLRVTILNTLYNEYQAWSWHSLLDEYYEKIRDTITSSMKLLTNEQHESVLRFIQSKVNNKEFYWPICLNLYFDLLKKNEIHLDQNENTIKIKLNVELLCTAPAYFAQIQRCQLKNIKFPEAIESTIAFMCISKQILKYKNHECSDIELLELAKPDCSLENALLTISDEYYKKKEIMLYDVDFTKIPWEKVECNTVIVNLMTISVEKVGWRLDRSWDFITISLSSLLQSLDKTKASWNTIKYSSLACAVFKLYCAVNKFIKGIPGECIKRRPSDVIVSLPTEWKEVFVPDITNRLMNIFLTVCGDCSSSAIVTSKDSFVICSLHEAMKCFDWKHFEKNSSPSILIHKLEESIEKCLNIMSSTTHHSVKYLCHTVLRDLTPSLILTDDIPDEQDEMPATHFSINKIMPSIIRLQECVEIILNQYQINESSCILQPHTDSFSIILGYLFLWDRILEIVRLSIPFLQHQYAEIFKNEKYVEKLVEMLFRLLPDEIKPNNPQTNYFAAFPSLCPTDPLKPELVGELSCVCFLDLLKCAPAAALVRSWWGSLPSKMSQYVEQVIKTHVSPEVIKFLLKEVASHIPTKKQDFHIVIHWSTSEILCQYKYDDTRMDLVITLGPTFPLCIPHIITTSTCSSNVAWLAMFLSYQNSSLWKVANLWLNSIERKLEVSSECYICYSKLHAQTGELAKENCKTCRNKFHQKCLFRWFRASSNTTCPLCRNKF